MEKIIFVTGASSGIGKELAIKFANSGWKVLASARRLELLKKLNKECINLNAIIPIKMDISNKKTVASQINKTIKKYGIPDIVLLNAGTNNPNSKNIFSIEETEQIFKINFFGTLNCLHILLPFLKKKINHKLFLCLLWQVIGGYLMLLLTVHQSQL